MDLHVRYWYNKTSREVTRYYGSEFQMHSDHEILSENLLTGIADLPEEKLMRSNVNWKVLEVIQKKREKDKYSPLADIGSCGLHVVSGALHMRGSVTGLYPEKVCVIWLVENEPVADRAIIIWNDIVTLTKAF